jgi:putative flavoprotein involved in K+ transport
MEENPMFHTRVVIIGAGQAGLAVSKLLTAADVDHVVLERDRTAERWISQRWDSLRLLTPNWMSRLPGWSYRGSDPAGFMPAVEVAEFLARYADSFGAPVVHGAEVRSVRRHRGRYQIVSEAGSWSAPAVVIATGYCDRPSVPSFADSLHPSVRQITPDRYRNPAQVPDGGVLVVGASSTGVQLADELAAAGRDVVLAVGRHTRLLRRYRGMDIMWWLDSMGVLDRTLTPAESSRVTEPSLQIVGSTDGRAVDLPSLAERGVRLVGRVDGLDDGQLTFADDLAATTSAADRKLSRLLHRIDLFAATSGLADEVDAAHRPRAFADTAGPLDRRRSRGVDGIRTVVWATGYRREYPWLHLPVLDAAGEIRQSAGRTPAPGLYVIGMRWQTRRSSTFLDGVRHDAALLADHLTNGALTGSMRSAS